MGRVSDAKQRLLDATIELIWQHSYGAVTVDNICERAGVKKGSFYYFFPSKTDLVVAAWVVRRGVDVTDDGIVARSLAGEHRLAWSEVAGIRVAERGELYVVTTRRTEMRLPVLRARDLPALAAASHGHIQL